MVWSPDPDVLRGRVAVVAGATRGAGRGVAAALGEAGATVICTGRGRCRYGPVSPRSGSPGGRMSVDWNGAGYRAQELLDVLAPAGDECEVPAGVDPEQMSAEVAARAPAGA